MFQHFCPYMAQTTRPIIPRASLRLPLGYGLLPPSGRACLNSYQAGPVMWHFPIHPTFRMRKIRAHPSRRRRIKDQAVGSGARVKDP